MMIRTTLFFACVWGALCYVELDLASDSSGLSVSDSYTRKNTEFQLAGALKVVLSTATLQECKDECWTDPGCMSYTRLNVNSLFWGQGTCFLFSGIGLSQETMRADSGVVPPKVQNVTQCYAVTGVTFTGQDLVDGNNLVVESAEQCCLRCQEKPGCKVFTFLPNDGTCWLRERAERTIIPKEPCQTGIINEAFGVLLPFKDNSEPDTGVDIDEMQWDFVQEGLLERPVDFVWKDIGSPADAMRLGFGQYAFSVIGSDSFTLTLASGKNFTFQTVATSKEKMFHVVKIDDHSAGIVKHNDTDLDLVGSQVFIQLKVQPNSHAKLLCGFLGLVSPAVHKAVVLSTLKGFFKLMVENVKIRFGDGGCPHKFLKREPQGSCNNPGNPTFGAANSPLKRMKSYDPSYEDGKSEPSGPGDISARLISNTVADQGTDEDNASNRMNLTDAMVTFAQFVAHDFTRTAEGSFAAANADRPFFSVGFDKFAEEFPIEVPDNDKFFSGHLEFQRGVWVRENNTDRIPRSHRNLETSYLDLSAVYGSNSVREDALRSYKNGKLKTGEDGFLPFNGHGDGGVGVLLDNVPISSTAYVAGDVRCNVSPNLAAIHALWMKEHNTVASELDDVFHDSLSDEELYRYAKAITIAEYQSIVYTEFLKFILGDDVLDPYDWRYNPTVDASTEAFFVAVAHRFGHSMINNFGWKVAKGQATPVTKATEKFLMRETFFLNMVGIDEASFGDFIRGMGWHEARELDIKVVNDLRNFLFTEDPLKPSMDLVSLNIQRARDFGLPMYNDAREAHGLSRAKTFDDVTCHEDLAKKLKDLYKSVDLIDPFIGGLAECPSSKDHLLGDLFHNSLINNYKRLRDGDRLFYKGLQFNDEMYQKYPRLLDVMNDKIKLLDIAIRNTDSTAADFEGRESLMQL
ncbi:hypothetical protein BSKO_07164 [Bryopsis sp. KO-2023]|nr:hypothetical protein BSKO_07164 [Bryopsis sp. KO-2023]